MLLSTRKFWSGIIPRPPHQWEAGRGKRKGAGARPSFDLLPFSLLTLFALLATGKDDGADERHQQHQRGDLERRRPVAEERFAQVAERHQGNLLRLARPFGRDGGEDRQAQEGAGSEGGERPLRTVERLWRVAHAGQHHREEDKDGDGAAVDQHLDDRQELGRKQDEDAGDGQQGEDEEQRAVDDVAGEDDTEGAEDGESRHEVEDDLFVAHGATVASTTTLGLLLSGLFLRRGLFFVRPFDFAQACPEQSRRGRLGSPAGVGDPHRLTKRVLELPGLGLFQQLVQVQHEVAAVVAGELHALPGVVHHDGVEVADLNADVAAHAARVVDVEPVDDLLALALPLRVEGVVLHRDRHAVHRAVAGADLTAGAERLVLLEVPEEDGQPARAVRQLLLRRWVLDGDRLPQGRRDRCLYRLQYTEHLERAPHPVQSGRDRHRLLAGAAVGQVDSGRRGQAGEGAHHQVRPVVNKHPAVDYYLQEGEGQQDLPAERHHLVDAQPRQAELQPHEKKDEERGLDEDQRCLQPKPHLLPQRPVPAAQEQQRRQH